MQDNPPAFLGRVLALLPIALATVLGAQPAAAQPSCLEVRVLDPTSAQLPAAVVSVGSREVPADDRGVATLCDLGPGPHSLVVLAPGFEPQEVTAQRATGQITVVLQIETFAQELVVLGSRAEARTVTESLVPVDVIAAEEFVQQGAPDLLSQLRNVVPSFNVNRQPIADAATIIRPANLRNLAPDHTLVLVNGKRRHRGAVISWIGGGVADGSQGADISVIPSIALKQVEVLRDGASAQYGSDAIAGVLNFTLKDAPSGGSVEVRAGTFQGGDIPDRGPDGQSITYAANVGMPLGEGGFANLSFEYGNSDPTDRSVQRSDATALIAAGNAAVRNPAQIWGSPEERNNAKFFGNFGKLVGESTQVYAHTNYASRKVTGGFFFRNPNTRGAVFSGDGGKSLLIGDALDARDGVLDGSAGCPVVPIVDQVPDQAALSQVFSDPNCFSFQELFPGGFTPNFGGFVSVRAGREWRIVKAGGASGKKTCIKRWTQGMFLWQSGGYGGLQATQRSVGRGSGSGVVAAGADVVVAVGGGEAPVALLAEPAQAGEAARRAVEAALRGNGAEAGGCAAEDGAVGRAGRGVGAGTCGPQAAQPGSVAIPVRQA